MQRFAALPMAQVSREQIAELIEAANAG